MTGGDDPSTVGRVAIAVLTVALVGSAVLAPVTATPAAAGVGADDAPPSSDAATTQPAAEGPSVQAWTVPGSADPANLTASELYDHNDRRYGTVRVAPMDTLAVQVRRDGLDAAVANRTGTRTERVLAALDAANFSVQETPASNETTRDAAEFRLNDSVVDLGGAPTEDTYLLLMEVDAVAGVGVGTGDAIDGALDRDRVGGALFRATFTDADIDEWRATSRPIDLVPSTFWTFVRDDRDLAAWTVPETVDVENATATDVLKRPDDDPVSVASGESIALGVTRPELDERVAACDDDDDRTTCVLNALEPEGGLRVREQTNGINRDPYELWLNDSTVRAVDVPGRNAYVLVVDVDAVAYHRDLEIDQQYGDLGPDGCCEPVAGTEAVGWLVVNGSPRYDVVRAREIQFEDGADATPSVDVWRIPYDVDAANASGSELAAQRRDGGERVNVTAGGALAVAVEVDGLDAAVEDGEGSRTERVLAALREEGHLAVVQTQETTPTGLRQGVLWLNASNVRAVPAGQDRYVLAVDADDAIGVRLANWTGGPDAFAETYAEWGNTSTVYRVFDVWSDEPRTYTARWFANDTAPWPAVETNRTVAFAPSDGATPTTTTTPGETTKKTTTTTARGETTTTTARTTWVHTTTASDSEPGPTLVGSDRERDTSPVPGFGALVAVAALATLTGLAVAVRRRRG